MILQHKHAVIYGAGGSLGGAVAKALAAAGAKVFLTGRNLASVQQTATAIRTAGGDAETAQVDATDAHVVNRHIQEIVQKAGSIDIAYNAVGIEVKQDVPLVDLTMDEYVMPVTHTLQTQFITATAAGKMMMKQGSGVILTLTATPGGIGYPYTGGFAAACCALENFSKNLASELGIYGVRVVNMRSGGSPDSAVFKDAIAAYPEMMEKALGKMRQDTMLKQLPLMADIANAAVFLASDLAGKITGITLDITAGTTAALNYRASDS